MRCVFRNGIILDGTKDMEPTEGMMILVDEDKIVDIVPDEDISGYQEIDLRGFYIMPGLINMHVHLPASGKPTKKQRDNKKLVNIGKKIGFVRSVMQTICEMNVGLELTSGVTTLRTMGGVFKVDTNIRNRVENGKIIGPRILASNMAVSVPGGHMAGVLAYEATSAQQAADYVRKIAQDKPDVIKLMITGGVLDAAKRGEPGVLKMPADYVKAACDAAHELGIPVAAHVESSEGVKVALENGVNTIEHGAKPDDEIIRLFKEKGAAHIATFSPAIPYAFFEKGVMNITDDDRYNGQIVFDGIVECAKACLENDIPVGLGTDTGCPYVTHYGMWRELMYFVKFCGVTPKFALYTATLGNAKIAGVDDLVGSIAPGKAADFVITRKNPLEDLHELGYIEAVVSRGKTITDVGFQRVLEVEDQMNKFIN